MLHRTAALLITSVLIWSLQPASGQPSSTTANFTTVINWLGGSTLTSQYGYYGIGGDPVDVFLPGARSRHCATAIGQSMYLFGGDGYGINAQQSRGFLNDLWRYDFVSARWQWLSGNETSNATPLYGPKAVASPLSLPGSMSLHSCASSGKSGLFYLFGGSAKLVTGVVRSNDLWTFNLTSKLWTWMQGDNNNLQGVSSGVGIAASTNIPGPRQDSSICADDSGRYVYVFGGDGYSISGTLGGLNDLWQFDIVTRMWTWMSGSNNREQRGAYGTLNVESSLNVPGSRIGHVVSMESNTANILLFGGRWRSVSSYLNDLWRFNSTSWQWTWLSGNYNVSVGGKYGTVQSPGSRFRFHFGRLMDSYSYLVYGGFGFDTDSAVGYMGDFWLFKMDELKWTWIGGSKYGNQLAVYNSSATDTQPASIGGRSLAISVSSAFNNKVILFGGESSAGKMSDFWELQVVNVSASSTLSSSSLPTASPTPSSSTMASSSVSSSSMVLTLSPTLSSSSAFTSPGSVTSASNTVLLSSASFTIASTTVSPSYTAVLPVTPMADNLSTTTSTRASVDTVPTLSIQSDASIGTADSMALSISSTTSQSSISAYVTAVSATNNLPSSSTARSTTSFSSAQPTPSTSFMRSTSGASSSSRTLSPSTTRTVLAITPDSTATLAAMESRAVDAVVSRIEEPTGDQGLSGNPQGNSQTASNTATVDNNESGLSVASLVAIVAATIIVSMALVFGVRWARSSAPPPSPDRTLTSTSKRSTTNTATTFPASPAPSARFSVRSGASVAPPNNTNTLSATSAHVSRQSSFAPSTTTSASEYSEYVVPVTEIATLPCDMTEFSLPGFLQFHAGKDFTWKEIVGQGGSGQVYVGDALNTRLAPAGTQVAVKIISNTPREAMNPQMAAAVDQEISIMHYLGRHRNIAVLLGWCDNPMAMIMKLYNYGSLEDWIADRQAVTKSHKLAFMSDTCAALHFMHGKDVAHCDIKPANILIDIDEAGSPFCVLTDFGISQVYSQQADLVKEFRIIKLRGASIVYAAPEVLKRHRLGALSVCGKLDAFRSDIYSLAILCFELLTLENGW